MHELEQYNPHLPTQLPFHSGGSEHKCIWWFYVTVTTHTTDTPLGGPPSPPSPASDHEGFQLYSLSVIKTVITQ